VATRRAGAVEEAGLGVQGVPLQLARLQGTVGLTVAGGGLHTETEDTQSERRMTGEQEHRQLT